MSRVQCVRFGWWLGLLVAGLASSPAAAQTTYTWDTTTTDNAWLNPANWTGGTAGTWPGLTAAGGSSNGTALDLAVIGNFAFPATNGVGIDTTAAGGSLTLGAIQFTSGSGNLQIGSSSGSGTLILSGATVNSVANVILANTSATNDLTVDNNASGTGNSMGLQFGNADNVILVNAGRTITINDVMTGAFSGGQPIASSVTVQGGGTAVFGNSANTFTGAVTVTGGSTLSTSADGNLGQKGATSRVILNNGTLLATGSYTIDSTRTVVIGTPDADGGTGTISVASGQTLAFGGVIQNAGSHAEQLIKTGAGTLQLGGTNTYTGGTAINAGTLQATANNVFAAGSTVTMANTTGAVFDVSNTGQTIGSLTGGGGSGGNVNLGPAGNLVVGGDNTSTTFSGLFTGSGTVTKTGSGTLTLTGNSTWTGPLNVVNGVVSISSTTRLNSSGTGLVTLDGGTLRETNPGTGGSFIAAGRGLVIGSNGGTVDVATAGVASIYAGTITGAGNTLTKVGLGEFRYQGSGTANSTFSKLVVNQGLFRIGSATGSSEVGFGAVPASPLADAITLNGGAIGASLSLTLNANRGITLGTNGGTIDGSGAALTVPGVISGSGALTKVGVQLVTLTGANTYSGGTTVSGGTLLVNGQTGTHTGTGTGAVAVNGGATLAGNGQAAGAVTVNSLGRIIGGQGTAVNEQLSLGNNLTLANNSTIRIAAGNGATASDLTLAGSSQVAVTGVLGRATATDRITIDLAFATGGNLDLTGGTTYTRRVATYGSLSNLTPGSYTAADNVFNVTSPSFGVDPGWTVLVGQNGNALDVVFTPVPEPGAVLAVGLAGLGLAGLVRRARRGGPATLS